MGLHPWLSTRTGLEESHPATSGGWGRGHKAAPHHIGVDILLVLDVANGPRELQQLLRQLHHE